MKDTREREIRWSGEEGSEEGKSEEDDDGRQERRGKARRKIGIMMIVLANDNYDK